MTTRLIAITTEPIALVATKLACRIDAADSDTDITSMMKAARELAEQETGRALALATWAKTMDAFPDEIELLHPPIVAIVEVSYLDANGATQILAPSRYVLDSASEPGWLVPALGTTWPATYDAANAVTVSYTAGDPGNCPESVKRWMYLQIRAWFDDPIAAASQAKTVTFADALLDRYCLPTL